jgi:hypothetical protein
MKTPALIAASVALCLSACDKPADRAPSMATTPTPVAGPEVPVAPGVHAVPAWAVGLIGKTFKDAYPGAPGDCLGNTDAINGKTDAGTEILGWGWDSAAAAVAPRILLVDAAGAIVGAGENGLPREDVIKAMPQVTSKTPGWSAFTTATTGEIKAYGLIAEGKSVCPLGGIKL